MPPFYITVERLSHSAAQWDGAHTLTTNSSATPEQYPEQCLWVQGLLFQLALLALPPELVNKHMLLGAVCKASSLHCAPVDIYVSLDLHVPGYSERGKHFSNPLPVVFTNLKLTGLNWTWGSADLSARRTYRLGGLSAGRKSGLIHHPPPLFRPKKWPELRPDLWPAEGPV